MVAYLEYVPPWKAAVDETFTGDRWSSERLQELRDHGAHPQEIADCIAEGLQECLDQDFPDDPEILHEAIRALRLGLANEYILNLMEMA